MFSPAGSALPPIPISYLSPLPAPSPSSSLLSSSSASLKRSISTPLFALKSGEQDLWKHNTNQSLLRLITKISVENFAKQMTLIDWRIFSKIQRNELKPGQWTGPMKYKLSPNVVQFTKRFNIVTFWVIDEILNLKTPKQRAELISWFIKLIQNLIELGNLHSSFAIKSALTSVSIHRLEKTWSYLNKKERQNFEKITTLFSESDNSQELRKFMEKKQLQSQCIPNLATFLRDIIHVDYSSSQISNKNYNQNNNNQNINRNSSLNVNNNNRYEKLETIYFYIEKCQQSNYDEIEPIEEVFNYLVSLRYIEELQKFREDDCYKKSLKLEPDPESKNNNKKLLSYSSGSNSHYDIRSLQHSISYQNQSTLELNKLHINNNHNNQNYVDLLNRSLNGECCLSKQEKSMINNNNNDFKPGHRKTSSLETNLFLSTLNSTTNSRTNTPTTNNNNSNNSHTNKLLNKINLIDDSPIIDINTYQVSHVYKRDNKPKLEMSKKKREDFIIGENGLYFNTQFFNNNFNSDHYHHHHQHNHQHQQHERMTYTDKDIIHSGCVNRKTIIKDKKKHPFSLWASYHLRLTNDSLLFCNNKHNQENHQKHYKKFPLSEWTVENVYGDDGGGGGNGQNNCSNVFTLSNQSCSTIYKIRTSTPKECQEWLQLIKETSHNNNFRKFYI